MQTAKELSIQLQGRCVNYRVVLSRSARKLRVRVGPRGVEVIQPTGRSASDVESFLIERAQWVLDELKRAEQLQAIRRPDPRVAARILFRGKPTQVRFDGCQLGGRGNKVTLADDDIVIRRGGGSSTPPHRSLERWLRAQARAAIEAELGALTIRLKQQPARVYVMGQRTKWGNCSAQRNLSFNWRLILAPDFVLRYLVAHEAVHLATPDHSSKFWLTVQSLCPEAERAKQWLRMNEREMTVNLEDVAGELTVFG